jgi:hypothetical protein
MTIHRQALATFGTLLVALLISAAYTRAETPSVTLTTLYTGGGYGVVPYAQVASGGASGNGAVSSLTPPTSAGGPWTETVLHSFGSGSDGSRPDVGKRAGYDWHGRGGVSVVAAPGEA